MKKKPAARRKHLRAARRAQRAGRSAEALEQALRVVAQRPRDAEVQREAGELVLSLGDAASARACFTRALELRPSDPAPLVGLGRAYLAEGNVPKAMGVGTVVTERAPDHGPGHLLHALVLREMWKLPEAYAAASRALELDPQDFQALRAQGEIAVRMGGLDEGERAFRALTRVKPDFASGWCDLGQVLARKGHSDAAREAFAEALRLDPGDVVSRWAFTRAVRPVHGNEASVEAERTRALPELEALEGTVKLQTPLQIRRAEAAIQDGFHFHYLGGDPLPLQRRHGALVHRIMTARFPEYAARPAMPPTGERIRIGFASSCFRDHTVSRLFEGWITRLDPERFEVFVYHLHPFVDATTERLRDAAEHFFTEGQDVARTAHRIAADRLHALVYPEVGMDRQILKLAALHLAPLQCTTFGHPVTTGLPSMDVMLSSELVEAPGADAHYSERLVRLPGTGLDLVPPSLRPAASDRAAFGLPEDTCLYLSCQSLFKYLPRFDGVFARIAERVPNAHFAFIGHPHESVTRVFRERLERTFDARGLSCGDRVTILPRLDSAQYLDLNRVGDVFLDTIDWSAGQTAIEAIACGLPIVTLPGEFARGRFPQAFLRRIDVTETIASSIDEYVDTAVALGNDPSHRADLRSRIEARRGRLYEDRSAIAALERFLCESVAQRAAASRRAEGPATVAPVG